MHARAAELIATLGLRPHPEGGYYVEGAPLDLFVAEPRFSAVTHLALGAVGGHVRPVHVVAAMRWQAARSTGDYTLASCAVGPGFAFADFAMLDDGSDDAAELRRLHPDLACLM